ncbi:uncharacterized protein SCHCODRAFT_02610669 [Schizophyllum commune H4-8]|nr:uncharacterized protein SCHCODRAFT_02610669 [Schizophyllum commune H4-8]KAI5897938.1 hypothetical protein SCHCODRAFT_02610669 [Schizophyllum commune H4-8]
MLAACTPQRLSLATPPPAPKKGASLAYIGNQADECEFQQVESLYQKMSRTHISSALPVTPPSKSSSSSAATGRGNQAKLNSSPLAGGLQSSPIAKQYQPQPSTPANRITGKREHSKPLIMKDPEQKLVLVGESDDSDTDDDYDPAKEGEEKDDEETSDESTEEDVATEPEDNGGANEPSGSGTQSNAMDAPPMASTSTSASTSRSSGLPGRFPIGYGRTQSPPLTGKRSSQDGPLEETSESKRIKSNDMDMSGPEPVSRQSSMSAPAPSTSSFTRHATTSTLFQNSSGFGTTTPSSQSSSTPSPFTRTSSAPNPFGSTNSGFGAFSGAQPHAAPTPTPSSQWFGANNQATQATPSPSAPTTQSAAQSPAPNAFTSAFASSADAFGMRRSAPSQPASTGQSGNSTMNPVNNINTSLTVSSLQPTSSATQTSHAGPSLQRISTNFSMMSASPVSAPPQQPPRDFMQESLMCHANAYSALKAFDDAVAAAHAPVLSASQPAASMSRSTAVVRPLGHSVSLPPTQPQSCLVQKLVQRHSTRTVPTLAQRSSSSLLSSSRGGAVSSSLGSPRSQRSEGPSSPLKTEGSNAWMWSETSRKIFEEERRLTIEDDKRRARKEAERARRKEEERELRRIERAAEKEALRKQRKRELKAREAEEAEERRMAAFPVPAFMYFEEQRRREKKRVEKEARRAAKKAAAAAEEMGETSLPGTWCEDEDDEESSAASSTTSDESVGSVSLSSEGGSDGPSDCELASGWGSRLRSALSWALPLATS